MSPREQRLERRLGVFSATTIIVGSMIGSGIFIAPSIMAGYIGSPPLFLALWGIAGLLTLLGALSYAELAAMMPDAGGQYVFLREAFGPRVAFLYGWTLFLVVQTGFNAAVAIAFAKFLGGVGLRAGEEDVVFTLGDHTLSRAQLVAVGVITVLTWINARGLREGALVQNVLTAMKVAAIALLAAAAFGLGKGTVAHFESGPWLAPKGVAIGLFGAIGVAMSKALFAFDAWNTVTFTAEEVREPQRNLPRALIAGTVVTTVTYTAACAAYLYVLPIDRMAGVAENRVAAEVAGVLFGPVGITLVSLAILGSTLGCVNGLVLSGARVLFAMARDGVFFQAADRLDRRSQTPRGALWLQAVWSCVLALSGTYDRLLTYVTFASLGFNALTVVALFVLRRTHSAVRRPYEVPGYPVTPALYLAGAAFFLAYIFVGDPTDACFGLAIVALGWPAYALFVRRGSR
ncbi:MAG TPA: amino acid permease [Polyangiaceae bacterium]|jgi:APA family basic amino acid/polyamine antiporter|nr:amino acid permease [Polyangiaceae bacterium]